MSNYFGIGIDAYIALQVSQCVFPRHSALFSVWSVLFKAFFLFGVSSLRRLGCIIIRLVFGVGPY